MEAALRDVMRVVSATWPLSSAFRWSTLVPAVLVADNLVTDSSFSLVFAPTLVPKANDGMSAIFRACHAPAVLLVVGFCAVVFLLADSMSLAEADAELVVARGFLGRTTGLTILTVALIASTLAAVQFPDEITGMRDFMATTVTHTIF